MYSLAIVPTQLTKRTAAVTTQHSITITTTTAALEPTTVAKNAISADESGTSHATVQVSTMTGTTPTQEETTEVEEDMALEKLGGYFQVFPSSLSSNRGLIYTFPNLVSHVAK